MDRSARGWTLARLVILMMVVSLLSCASLQPKQDTQTSQQDSATAAELFADGMNAFNRNDMDLSRQSLAGYLGLAPQGEHVAEALLTLGKIALNQRRYDEARANFNAVSMRFPDTRYDIEARHLMQTVNAQRPHVSQETPAAIHTETVPAYEVEPAPTLASKASHWNEFVSAVEAYDSADAGQKSAAAARLLQVVDRMTTLDLDRALRETSHGRYERSLLLFRLGALAMHQQQWDRARSCFSQLVNEAPAHELSRRATAALERISERQSVLPTRIGLLLPPNKGGLVYVRDAMQMAADDARADSGGVLEFVFAETKGDPVTTVAAVDELILKHHVVAIVGTLIGDVAEAAAYRAEQYEVPLISLSPREGLPQIGSYVFRAALTPHMQAKAIVDYAWDVKGLRNFAIFYPMHPYGSILAMAFWDEVARRGGRITGVERYRHDETSFRTHIRNLVGRYFLSFSSGDAGGCHRGENLACGQVSAIQGEKTQPQVDFEAIFIPDYARQVAAIAPTIPFEEVEIDNGLTSTYGRIARTERRMGIKVPMVQLLGGNGWNSPRLNEMGGKYVAGSLFVDGFYIDEQPSDMVADFVTRFKGAYNETPAAQEAYAYDAVRLVANVLLVRQPRNREQLRDALLSMQNSPYTGVTDKMYFDSNGDMVNELVVLTLKEGKIVPAVNHDDIENDEPVEPEG
jgi:ABC-type branched-subunit amino acid transport system substrate-binding protein/outer membrane protein assembly factor BamD (BamD/ComL family)